MKASVAAGGSGRGLGPRSDGKKTTKDTKGTKKGVTKKGHDYGLRTLLGDALADLVCGSR